MKKSIITALVLFTLTAFTLTGKTWKSDQAHSQLMFTATHMGISDVSGTFNDFKATLVAGKPDLSDATIEMTAKVASIDTRVEKRDEHLKSEDFLDEKKFPELNFKSTSIKPAGKNTFKLNGKLLLHGVTKPVALTLFYIGTIKNPMNEKLTAGYRVTGTISRKDFNIGVKFQAPLISDAIRIKADGEFQLE
ncbi:YceI family protein [Mucilaginibacter defluvii]|uniref:YceI family protein n=2 Tax=Mucilaginibacter defluvii TaxID=1196019 RepID=A0ABP9G184_9SPHI